jgi:alanyl-tRNA synthetase
MSASEPVWAFERDPYRRELDTEVREAGQEGDRAWALLADTILYPEGGGQPADRGRINGVGVIDVQRVAGRILHTLERGVAPGPADVRLDWARRFDHMQQHTAQHLLTAVAQDRFGWPTTAFHLGAELCDIELEVQGLAPAEMDLLEEVVVTEIRAAHPVTSRRVALHELERLSVRTRGLPSGHTGSVRLVEIAGVDLNTCGGTHLRSTAEIEAVKLLGTEAMRGGTRLFFVAGARARRRLAAHEARNAQLRAQLGAPDHELVAVAAAKLEQLRTAQKRLRATEEELADALISTMAAQPGALIEAHFEGKDAAFLQKLARGLIGGAPAKLVFLTGGSEGAALFVLAAGAQTETNVTALGQELAELLGAHGGGSRNIFQGKFATLSARAAAVQRLRSGSTPPPPST